MSSYSIDTFAGKILLQEDINYGFCGARIWSSAPVLCKHIEKQLRPTIAKQVRSAVQNPDTKSFQMIELGAGLGLHAVMMAKVVEHELRELQLQQAESATGAIAQPRIKVVASDMDVMIPLLTKNVLANVSTQMSQFQSGRKMVEILPLKWTSNMDDLTQQLATLEDKQFDIILGSDICYIEDQVVPLLDTIAQLARSTTSLIFVCYEIRNEAAHRIFLEEVERKFDIRRIPTKKQDAEYRSDLVLLYQLNLKQSIQ